MKNIIRRIIKEELSKLNESMFIIFKDNEPYEVVGSRKEAEQNKSDYELNTKGSKYVIGAYDKYAKQLKKLKPKSYSKLEKLVQQYNKVK